MPASSNTDSIPMDVLDHSTPRDKSPAPSIKLSKRDYAIGISLLLVVVFLWTSSNFVTQDLFVNGYPKPFLVTYLNTSAFTLYLVPVLIRQLIRKPWPSNSVHHNQQHESYQPLATDIDSPTPDLLDPPSLPPLTMLETAKLAFTFCFLWFIANYCVNASLDYTSVASATILSSMSGFFTLAVGRLFRVEILTTMKIAAVLTSFVGVVLVSLSDMSEANINAITGPKPALGDFLALVSALFYALYVILLKVRIGSESRIDMQLFFGFVGLFNVLSCWPLGIMLHWSGIEPFELPTNRKEVIAIFINMFITLSSDFIYVLAMLKTTPLVVTVGLSLTIPLAVIGDFILNRPSRIQVIGGALLVLVSFIAIGYEGAQTRETDEALAEEAVSLEGQENR